MEPLETGWVVDGNIEKFDEVTQAMRQVLRASGSKTKNVALALPPSNVITKKITLPDGLSEKELEDQIESEANKYIPFSLDEVGLDFCKVGTPVDDMGDVEILIAAARKEKISDRQGLAEAAGLKPIIMDIESYASRRAASYLIKKVPNQADDSVIVLFEVGALNTSMQAIRNEEVLYERDQPFGGAALTQMIARRYELSNEEAEKKKRANKLPSDYQSNVLRPFLESFSQEIGRFLQVFFASTPYKKIDYIFLAGGTSALPGLADVISQKTSYRCEIVNPFNKMETSHSIQSSKILQTAPSYLTATGLALRRFFQ